MAYLFVDRILAAGDGPGGPMAGHGVKEVGERDPFLRAGPDGSLELSPCFAGEAVGQLAAWLAMSSLGFTRRPVAGLTAEVEVLGAARAGDRIDLLVEIESLEEDAIHYHGEARVRGEPILRLRHSVGPMLPMEGFDDPQAVKRQFEALTKPRDSHLVFRQDILERDAGRILAAGTVPASAPYLDGHFPRDPVLPATLLFDAQAALAALLLGDEGPAARMERLSDLKVREFLRPGTRVLSEARLLERRADRAVAALTGRVGERVVSSGSLTMRL